MGKLEESWGSRRSHEEARGVTGKLEDSWGSRRREPWGVMGKLVESWGVMGKLEES